MTTTNGTVRSADGTTIAYERVGEGPAVMLVDAAGQFRGSSQMRDLATRLAGELTVYCYDRRGRGESTDTAPYAVDREVEDLHALVEAAGGSAAVYGHSSGAVLALHAAAAGVAIPSLVLLEPPVELDAPPVPDGKPELSTEVEELVAAGRRGDAFLHVLRSVGVPEEIVEQMRQGPNWPDFQALAHTLAYDPRITATMTEERLRKVDAPTLVVNSKATDDRLMAWGRRVADTVQNGTHRALPGEWHGVAPDDLAPVIAEHVKEA